MKAPDVHEAVQLALAGQKSVTLCPAHDDKSPSLSVAPGKTHPVVFNCHANCTPDEIIEAAGLNWADVSLTREERESVWTPAGDATKVYEYRNALGTLVFQVLRVDLPGGGKRILQRQPDRTERSGWKWSTEGAERVLYRLPEVLAAVRSGHTVHVAEGEKCVHALLGVIPSGDEATCNPMGAGKWEDWYSEALAGANVVIYADSDDAGRSHARHVRESLIQHGCTVRILEVPPGTLRSGKPITDIADHIEHGLDSSTLLETTPESQAERVKTGVDVLDLIQRPKGKVEFVIDKTLAKGERLILIGFEGHGKSTLCRQVAVMVAAGLHPFTGMDMEPRKVLFIDAENHPDQTQDSWENLVGLAGRHAKAPIERGMLTVLEQWESEVDLAGPEGSAWLQERVHAYQPDLVVAGPLTNMASKDLRDDEPVRRIKNAVNAARSICNSAFILEHHAPLKGPADRERQLRPYGSSMFLKWPDYGYGIKPTAMPGTFEWYKNRGPRVRSRHWPSYLREGVPNTDEWPWMEFMPTEEEERQMEGGKR